MEKEVGAEMQRYSVLVGLEEPIGIASAILECRGLISGGCHQLVCYGVSLDPNKAFKNYRLQNGDEVCVYKARARNSFEFFEIWLTPLDKTCKAFEISQSLPLAEMINKKCLNIKTSGLWTRKYRWFEKDERQGTEVSSIDIYMEESQRYFTEMGFPGHGDRYRDYMDNIDWSKREQHLEKLPEKRKMEVVLNSETGNPYRFLVDLQENMDVTLKYHQHSFRISGDCSLIRGDGTALDWHQTFEEAGTRCGDVITVSIELNAPKADFLSSVAMIPDKKEEVEDLDFILFNDVSYIPPDPYSVLSSSKRWEEISLMYGNTYKRVPGFEIFLYSEKTSIVAIITTELSNFTDKLSHFTSNPYSLFSFVDRVHEFLWKYRAAFKRYPECDSFLYSRMPQIVSDLTNRLSPVITELDSLEKMMTCEDRAALSMDKRVKKYQSLQSISNGILMLRIAEENLRFCDKFLETLEPSGDLKRFEKAGIKHGDDSNTMIPGKNEESDLDSNLASSRSGFLTALASLTTNMRSQEPELALLFNTINQHQRMPTNISTWTGLLTSLITKLHSQERELSLNNDKINDRFPGCSSLFYSDITRIVSDVTNLLSAFFTGLQSPEEVLRMVDDIAKNTNERDSSAFDELQFYIFQIESNVIGVLRSGANGLLSCSVMFTPLPKTGLALHFIQVLHESFIDSTNQIYGVPKFPMRISFI